MTNWAFETKQVHSGQTPDSATGARALPIYQTTVVRVRGHDAGRRPLRARRPRPHLHAHRQPDAGRGRGHGSRRSRAAWPRCSSPRAAAANAIAIQNLAEAGDHIVSSPSLYGGTYNLFHYTLPKYGIEVSFVENPDDPESVARGRPPQHQGVLRRVHLQPQAGPARHRGRGAAVAHEIGVPLIVDNTVATPVPHPAVPVGRRHRHPLGDQVPGRPRHGDRRRDRRRRLVRLRAGPGALPAVQHPRPELQRHRRTPATSASAARLGANLAFILKARVQLLRDLGPAISPFNAFLIAQGIETLSLRVERHVENAIKVARVPRRARRRRERQLRGPRVLAVARAAAQVRAARRGLGARVRDRGRRRGRPRVCRRARASLARGQHRRRALARDPPGDHDALAADRGGAGHDGRHARPGAPLGGHRAHRRHPGRPRDAASPRPRRCARARRRSRASRRTRRATARSPMDDDASEWVDAPPTPVPASGAWRPGDHPGERRFLDIGDLPLEADPLGRASRA